MMLEINGLVKKYKDFTLNCSMKVERGRITGLWGKTGLERARHLKLHWGLSVMTMEISD